MNAQNLSKPVASAHDVYQHSTNHNDNSLPHRLNNSTHLHTDMHSYLPLSASRFWRTFHAWFSPSSSNTASARICAKPFPFSTNGWISKWPLSVFSITLMKISCHLLFRRGCLLFNWRLIFRGCHFSRANEGLPLIVAPVKERERVGVTQSDGSVICLGVANAPDLSISSPRRCIFFFLFGWLGFHLPLLSINKTLSS